LIVTVVAESKFVAAAELGSSRVAVGSGVYCENAAANIGGHPALAQWESG